MKKPLWRPSEKRKEDSLLEDFSKYINIKSNYNFKTLSSDVGTKVYAYGYPLALSVMGREIKVTDGMINSKTGYDGDITTYQISAPIQGGNSAGPLFDDNYLSKLTIINKRYISNEEIKKVIYQSLAVFSIHNVAAQSGVLPLAYSLSTPSIMRNLPAFVQYKIDDNLILSTDFNVKEIYSVCDSVLKDKNNFSKYEKKCQLAFDKYFSENNFELFYSQLINKINK